MDLSTSFNSKMTKMENLLSILNNEVDSTINLLNYLKQNSSEMVEGLRHIHSSSVFFKEFLEINSFLLKYLDFLTEINCKFELLQASEKQEKMATTSICSTPLVMLSSKKSETQTIGKDNLEISEVLVDDVRLNFLSDSSSFVSNNNSCSEKTTVSIKGKIKKLKRKKKKENESNKNSDAEGSCIEENPTVCEEVGSQSPLENEIFDKVKDINESRKLFSHSSESEKEKPTELSPVSESCTSVKEPNTKQKASPIKLPKTEEIPEVMSSTLSSASCNDKLFEIKPINMSRKLGEEFIVEIEHIISPSEFYVYVLEKHLNSFRELEKKLKLIQKDTSFYKKKEKNHFSQTIGKYALYYSKCDEKWCRAKITDWRLNYKDDFVYIFLIDYGESKCVVLDDLQPMPDRFKFYPAFIQRCHLSGIYPVETNQDSKTLAWSKAASEKMKCLIDMSNNYKIKIAPEDIYHPVKSLPVTLWLLDQNESCVNELLVKSQHAKSELETVKKSYFGSMELEKWNPMKEDFNSYLNSYDLDVNDPAAAIYGYVGKDYDRVCWHYANTGKCFKGKSCKKEHSLLNPLGFTTDQEEVYKNAVNALPLPPPKSVISVQVTCILSLNLFCCIRDDSAWTSEEETLKSLVQYMNASENIRDMKKLLIPPSVGQLVIAKYSVDESWYRAKIIESQPESDQYSVLFVDYGNNEEMPLSNIRAIEGRYLHLPFQAMKCCIFGITHNPKIPLKQCLDYLNKRMTDEQINLEVVTTIPGDHPQLLVHVFDQNGKNIGADLIAMDYAIVKKELLVSSESTTMPG